jgi:hypothetical protein
VFFQRGSFYMDSVYMPIKPTSSFRSSSKERQDQVLIFSSGVLYCLNIGVSSDEQTDMIPES